MCSGRSWESPDGVRFQPHTEPSRATTRSHKTSAQKDASGADGKVPAARGRPAGTALVFTGTRRLGALVSGEGAPTSQPDARGHLLG